MKSLHPTQLKNLSRNPIFFLFKGKKNKTSKLALFFMQTQDWEPVYLTKSIPVPKSAPRKSDEAIAMAKLEREEAPLPKVHVGLQQAIQQARLSQKMSQKDLAQKMNVPVATIQSYENGTALPNNSFIARLEKTLQTKLPRIQKSKKEEEA
jgi:ribosome-binding protein aMBF1 (putative translation factor)